MFKYFHPLIWRQDDERKGKHAGINLTALFFSEIDKFPPPFLIHCSQGPVKIKGNMGLGNLQRDHELVLPFCQTGPLAILNIKSTGPLVILI